MSETANLVIKVDSASAKTAFADVTNLTGALQRLEQGTDSVGKKSVQIGDILGRQNAQMIQEIRVTNDVTDASQRFSKSMQFQADMVAKTYGQSERASAIAAQFSKGEIDKANAVANALEKIKAQASAYAGLSNSQDSNVAKGNEFIAGLKRQVDTLGMSAKELRAYEAAQLGVSDKAAPFIEKLDAADKGMNKLNFSSDAVKREIINLGTEITKGNWEKAGESLISIAEKSGALEMALGAVSTPVLAIGAAMSVFAGAAIAGARETDTFNKQMALTGGYAGITKGQFDEMAAAIANSSSVGIGTAKEVLQSFIATGNFTGETLQLVTKTAIDFGEATGQSSSDVAKDFDKMSDGVEKWALEHNKQYHFLTAAQYEQIQSLEEQGKASEAVAVAMEALNDHIPSQTQNLGSLERSWLFVKNEASAFWDVLKGIGREETAEEKIKKLQKVIQNSGRTPGIDDSGKNWQSQAQMDANVKNAQTEIDFIERNKQFAERMAQIKAKNAATQAATTKALSSQKTLDDTLAKPAEKEANAVKEYKLNQEKIRIGDQLNGTQYAHNAAKQEKTLASIHDQFKTKGSDKDPAEIALARQLELDQAAVEELKRHNATLQKLEDLRHQNGEESDKEYIANKNARVLEDEQNQIDGYNKQLAHLKAFHGKTDAANEENAKKQFDLEQKLGIAKQKYADDKQIFAAQAMYAERLATEESLGVSDKQIAAVKKQLEFEEQKLAQMGMSKSELEKLADDKMRDAAATEEQTAQENQRTMATTRYSEELDKLSQKLESSAALKRRVLQVKEEQVTKQTSIKKLDDLNDFLDPKKAKSFSEVLKDGFGEAGAELSKLAKAFEDYSGKQEALDKKRIENSELLKAKKIEQSEHDQNAVKLNEMSTKQSLDGFTQMSSAAKSFFAEGSNGYKAMNAAETIFHAASMAMTIADMAKKLFAVTAVATATVASEATVTAATVAGEAERNVAKTPGVFMSFMSSLGPWGMAAAAVAVAAVLGSVTGGGSGGGVSAADMQKTQGTGSVFGDSSAKSDSIGKSLEALKNNSNLMLPVNQSMLTALKNIQASLSGLANLVIRTPGVANGDNMNIVTGQLNKGEPTDIVSSIGSSLLKISLPGIGGPIASFLNNLWGKTTQNIVDSGIQFGGSLSALQKGQGYNQYASVNTTTSSFFGLVKNTSNSVQTQTLNNELSSQLGLIFTNLEDALKSASQGLGVSAKSVEETLNQLQISTTTVSLKGLSGTALTEALNAVISKTMDEIAVAALPGLEAFRQIGEGYAQTAIRVASNVEVAGNELEKLGITAISFKDVIYKQGDVGAEIVRQSIENVETVLGSTLNGVGKIIADMSGSAADLAKAYKELVDIRKQMSSVGMNGSNLNVSLIKGAGGTSELSSGLGNYLTNYFSEAEHTAAKTKILTDQFAALGITMPKNREAFRQLINDTGTSTDATSLLTGKLLMLADSFNTVMSASDKVSADNASKAKDLANKQSEMQMQLMELQGKSSEVLQLRRKAELAAMDESLRPLQERIYALQDEKTATDAALTAAKQHRALDIELMTATGDTEGALAAKRADALAGMDDYSKGIQKQIWAAEDARAALEKAQQSAAKAQQEQEAAHQLAQQAAQQAQQDAQRIQQEAQQAYEQRLNTAKTALQNAYNAEAGAMQNVISKMQGFSTAARAMQQTLYSAANSPVTVPEQYVNARADLPGVIADAKSGNQDSIAKLQQFVNLSQQSATDFNDYRRDFALVQNTLDESASEAERQVKQNQTQLDLMKSQVDGLLNVNNSVLSVNDAIKALQDVMAGGLNGVANALNGQYKANNATSGVTTSTKPTPDQIYGGLPGEGEIQQRRAAAMKADAQKVAQVQQYIQDNYGLESGYNPGSAGNQYYMDLNTKYFGPDSFKIFARQLGLFSDPDLPTASQLPAFASGGYFAGGLRLVGENGPELEVTGPSRIFSASQTASMLRGNSGSGELVSEIQMLRAEVRAVASNTAGTNKTLDRWTNVGMPATEAA